MAYKNPKHASSKSQDSIKQYWWMSILIFNLFLSTACNASTPKESFSNTLSVLMHAWKGWKGPYTVKMLHVVDKNKLNIKEHVHQYYLNIDGYKA